MYLMPIEQDILTWQIAHPVAHGFIIGAFITVTIAVMIVAHKRNRDRENELMKREREAKRAWIKANGGL